MTKSLINNRYQLIQPLAKNARGAAEVWEARDTRGALANCALKITREEYRSHEGAAALFVREKEILERLKGCRHVVELLDAGPVTTQDQRKETGRYFVAVELVRDEFNGTNGRNLDEFLHEGMAWGEKKQHVQEAAFYAKLLTEAVREIHARKVVHRDLKPHNVVVGQTPNRVRFVKIVDFALSKRFDVGTQRSTEFELTRPEQYWFMAPECAVGGRSRAFEDERRIDVYSFGAMIYWIATSVCPYESAFYEALSQGKTPVGGTLTPPSARGFVGPHLPPELAVLVGRAVAVNPAERPTFDSLAAAVDAWDPALSFKPSRPKTDNSSPLKKEPSPQVASPKVDPAPIPVQPEDAASDRTIPTPMPSRQDPLPEPKPVESSPPPVVAPAPTVLPDQSQPSPATRYSPLKYPKGLMLASRYEIDRPLGRGSFAIVYLARDAKVGGQVAIKIPFEDQEVEDLLKEARRTRKIRSPNVVTIHDLLDEHDPPLIVMDYIDGRSLDDVVKDGGPASMVRFRELAFGLSRGLKDAHDQKIIHRDLSPKNILVEKSGQPYITDFGLAKVLDEGNKVSEKSLRIGHNYFAFVPEEADSDFRLQTVSKDVGPHSDVYQIGAIFYYIATAEAPFRLNAVGAWGDALHKIPDPVGQRNPAFVGTEVEQLIARCLEKDWRKRPKDGAELLQELQKAVNSDIVTKGMIDRGQIPPPKPAVLRVENDGSKHSGANETKISPTEGKSGPQPPKPVVPDPETRPNPIDPGRGAHSGPVVPPKPNVKRRVAVAALVAMAAILAAYKFINDDPKPLPPPPPPPVVNIEPKDAVPELRKLPTQEFFKIATSSLCTRQDDTLFVPHGQSIGFKPDGLDSEGAREAFVTSATSRPDSGADSWPVVWTHIQNTNSEELNTSQLKAGQYNLSVTWTSSNKKSTVTSSAKLSVLGKPAAPKPAVGDNRIWLRSLINAQSFTATPNDYQLQGVREYPSPPIGTQFQAVELSRIAGTSSTGAEVGVERWKFKYVHKKNGNASSDDTEMFFVPECKVGRPHGAGAWKALSANQSLNSSDLRSLSVDLAVRNSAQLAGLGCEVRARQSLTGVSAASQPSLKDLGSLEDGDWELVVRFSKGTESADFPAGQRISVDSKAPYWSFAASNGPESRLTNGQPLRLKKSGFSDAATRPSMSPVGSDGSTSANDVWAKVGPDLPAVSKLQLPRLADSAGNATEEQTVWIVNLDAKAFDPNEIVRTVWENAKKDPNSEQLWWVAKENWKPDVTALRRALLGDAESTAEAARAADKKDWVISVLAKSTPEPNGNGNEPRSLFAQDPLADGIYGVDIRVRHDSWEPDQRVEVAKFNLGVDTAAPQVVSWSASPSPKSGQGDVAEIEVLNDDVVTVDWRDEGSGIDSPSQTVPKSKTSAEKVDHAGNKKSLRIVRKAAPQMPDQITVPPATKTPDEIVRIVVDDMNRARNTSQPEFTAQTAFVGANRTSVRLSAYELSKTGVEQLFDAVKVSKPTIRYEFPQAAGLIPAEIDVSVPASRSTVAEFTIKLAELTTGLTIGGVRGRLRLPTSAEWVQVVQGDESRALHVALGGNWPETLEQQQSERIARSNLIARGQAGQSLFGSWGSSWEIVLGGNTGSDQIRVLGGGWNGNFEASEPTTTRNPGSNDPARFASFRIAFVPN